MPEKDTNISEFVAGQEGRLNLDDHPLAFPKNDFSQCLNLTQINIGGGNDWVFQPVNGNSFVFDLPTIVSQVPIYKIIFGNSTGKNLQIDFENLNGTAFNPALTSTAYTTTNNLSTDTADWITVIEGAFSSWLASTGGTLNITSPTAGTIVFSISLHFDYDILIDAANTVSSLNIIQTQEYIDETLTGLCLPIGNYTYSTGDLFVLSTSRTQEPISFDILGTQSGAGFVQINIAGNQLAYFTPNFGQEVVVEGVGGTIEANGTWTQSAAVYNSIVAGQTTLTLFNSTYANAFTSGGTITLYSNGLLNITVAQSPPNRAATWTTYSLLTTTEVDARFYNPCRRDVVGTINNNITSLYWTDGSDFMRIFQYQGAYVTNGAITAINPLGYYIYGGIDLATRNIINYSSPVLKVSGIIYSGGGILSGNWRYTGYYLDSNLTPSSVGILTNPVNIYAQGSPSQSSSILGTPGLVSGMQVTLTVEDVPVGVFPYFQLIGINYAGDTEVAYLIKQVPVPADKSSFTITHTGLEETISDYGGGFALPSVGYDSAQTQTFSNNCLIYGNLTAAQIADFSSVAQATTHTINRNTNPSLIQGDGLMPIGDDVYGFTFGEYQDPLSTNEYVGYMFNECYRFWMLFELYDGTATPLFWVDDILFDLDSTNRANPFGNNRRTANNIPNYDLSPNVDPVNPPAVNPYVIYPKFSNNALNKIIDGKPFNQIVKRIHFFVTDNATNELNEILACGLMVRHVSGLGNIFSHGADNNIFGQGSNGTNTYMFDNPFLMVNPMESTWLGTFPLLGLGADNNTYANAFGQATPPHIIKWQYADWNPGLSPEVTPLGSPLTWAYSCSFYAPDEIYGQVGLSLRSGDAIFNHGQQAWFLNSGGMDMTLVKSILATTTTYWGTEIRLSGANGITADDFTTNNNVLSYAQEVSDFSGLLSGLPNGTIYCGGSQSDSAPGSIARVWQTPHHVVLYANGQLTNTSQDLQGNEDIGLYYGQYYRPLALGGSYQAASQSIYYPNNTKFGAIDTGTGIPTGFYIDITPEIEVFTDISVYGGDTFTQKNFLKLLYPTVNAYDGVTLGGGVTCVYVGQNRMNFNMRNPSVLAYPFAPSISEWINNTTQFAEQDNYDAGYTPRNPDQIEPAFNSATPYIKELGNREIVSSPRNEASLENFNRIFLPLSFTDLPADFGYITNIFTIQEELYSLQPRKYYKQNFQNRASLQADTASAQNEVILGSATQFSSPPFDIIEGGNSNNFALIKGKGINGEDVVAWIDTLSRQCFIMSKNGIETISLTKKMRSWFENNLTWVTKDNPHISNGITGVFDNKRKEFIWTIMAMMPDISTWNNDTTYVSGDAVQSGLVTNTNIAQIYVSLINNNIDNDPILNLVQVTVSSNIGFSAGHRVIDSLGNTGTIVSVGTLPTVTVGSTNFVTGTNFSGTLTDTTSEASSGIIGSTHIWQTININDTNYYNFTTIAYSLLKQSFLFYTPTPYEYIQWKETYLSFYPNTSYNGAYLSDVGTQLTWFTYSGNSQTANASLAWIINDLPDISKSYLGVWFNSQNIPNYLLFTTPSCSSYLAHTDPLWVNMNNGDGYYNSIQYDTLSDPNGSPQGISGNIYGKWASVQMTFIVGQAQYLYKAITKWKSFFRNPQN